VIYGPSNSGNSDDLESPQRSFPTASLSTLIVSTAVQQLTRFQLIPRVARSLCGSGASFIARYGHYSALSIHYNFLPSRLLWWSGVAVMYSGNGIGCINKLTLPRFRSVL